MLSKTIELLSTALVAQKKEAIKKRSLALFCLFGVVSGSIAPALACYDLFQTVSIFKSDGFTECFDLQIHVRYCYEVGQLLVL